MGNIEKFKKIAKDKFLQRDYKFSMLNYSFALKESPHDKEAKIGAILCDMADEQEDEAIALFDFYEIEKKLNSKTAEDKIGEIIDSHEESFEGHGAVFNQNLKTMIDEAYGISYQDFLIHIETRGDFKSAFEDLMFSTKIVINDKLDLFDFILKLIENNFYEVAYDYIEHASHLFLDIEELHTLLLKFQKDDVED